MTPSDASGAPLKEILFPRFQKAALGMRGYNKDDVDAFLAVIRAAIAGRHSLKASDIHNVNFRKSALWRSGYDEGQVDSFLGVVEAEFARHEEVGIVPGQGTDGEVPRADLPPRASERESVRLTVSDIRNVVFRNRAWARGATTKTRWTGSCA
jgi:DivIVA domain-containing protein